MSKRISKGVKILLVAVTLMASVMFYSSDVLAAGTCKVGEGTCNIRSSASTSGNKVTSVSEGTELSIESQVTGSDSKTWYKVSVNGSTGYIRSDLVTDVSGDIPTETSSDSTTSADTSNTTTSTDTSSTTTTSTDSAASTDTTVNPSTVLTAKVNTDNVSVRAGASTKTEKKATAASGTEVTVSGEATDDEGKTWYQVSYNADNKTVNGFIRSDFLEVLTTQEEEPETVEEEATEEEPVVEETVNTDYEVKYEPNSDGENEWYLYDHIKGTKQSINNIYAVMEQSQQYAADDDAELQTMRIVVIVLAVIVVGLIITVTILAFKLRDANYDDYDDYDDYGDDNGDGNADDVDDVEEPEEEPYEEEKPKKRIFGRGKKEKKRRYEEDDEDYEDEEEEEEEDPRPSKRGSDSRKPLPARGMLDSDDDMEFEFLDLE